MSALRTRAVIAAAIAVACGCHATNHGSEPDAASATDASGDGTSDGSSNVTPLGLACAATAATFNPGPCPAPAGGANTATFCFRPQWPGVTSVDVYGGFGQAGDWTSAFTTLTDNGTGTFVATVSLPNGAYPYMFRVHGSADNLVKDRQFLDDQLNPSFVPAPAQAPVPRSVSQLTVPQVAAPIHHVRGVVTYAGVPQPCFSVDLEVGELLDNQNRPISEHTTGNFTESAADGTFDFPVADGHLMAVVRFPFLLAGKTAPYPDPLATPSIGYARTGFDMAGADLALDAADVAYPIADYTAMSPTSGTATLPMTFTYTLAPGSTAASVAVIGTSIAGNDPAYWSPYSTNTSLPWDGTLGNGMKAQAGTQYYWGTWQHRGGATTTWNQESLLFPIQF